MLPSHLRSLALTSLPLLAAFPLLLLFLSEAILILLIEIQLYWGVEEHPPT